MRKSIDQLIMMVDIDIVIIISFGWITYGLSLRMVNLRIYSKFLLNREQIGLSFFSIQKSYEIQLFCVLYRKLCFFDTITMLKLKNEFYISLLSTDICKNNYNTWHSINSSTYWIKSLCSALTNLLLVTD